MVKVWNNEKLLLDYNINGLLLSSISKCWEINCIDSASTQMVSADSSHRRVRSNISAWEISNYELTLVVGKTSSTGNLALGLDFTFHTIKDVKRVDWSKKASKYCEIGDGMWWMWYCLNEDCHSFEQLFIINRGYGKFTLSSELRNIGPCPVWNSANVKTRNVGFVRAEWKMQGILKRKTDNKVNSTGQSYDGKLYTFKEMDYYSDWVNLRIEVKSADILPEVSDESESLGSKIQPKLKLTSRPKGDELDQDLDPIEDITDAPSVRLQESWFSRMWYLKFQ
jgi:hypothetical protein